MLIDAIVLIILGLLALVVVGTLLSGLIQWIFGTKEISEKLNKLDRLNELIELNKLDEIVELLTEIKERLKKD